jgi:FKBP12-rapamycin complex-associated protein
MMALDSGALMPMQALEIFEHALQKTQGLDLAKILWIKSQNAEVWLDRRRNYTRSLAVMSMVGEWARPVRAVIGLELF